MNATAPLRRRRRWPVFAPLGLVVVLAALWSGFWFYAADRAQKEIEGWRAREVKAGRTYRCGSETVGGYPFRIEVRCANASAEFRNPGSASLLKLTDLLVAAQVYDPSLLIGEFAGPLTMGDVDRPPVAIADWKLAEASLRGDPRSPQRLSLVFEEPRFDRIAGGVQDTLVRARHMELHGRMAGGSAADHPAIELALALVSAVAPTWHPLMAQPVDADIRVTLRGLDDFAPKPWPTRFREIQARGGRLDVTAARIQQDDLLAVGAGSLSLTARGGLDGQLDVTIAGLEKLLRALNVDQIAQQQASGGQIGQALDRLDRILPGLGNLARQQAGPALTAGLAMLGRPTKLEGRDAVSLPLRFNDGAAFLGPVPVGKVPPLF